MQLKTAILHSLARDDLKQILDDLDVDGVDRRSVDAMRTALGRARRLTLEGLVGYLRKDSLRAICEELGLPGRGRREELVQRLLAGDGTHGAATSKKQGSKIASVAAAR
jgi:hypothetical protein